jgi:putative ABC transport system permease protein
MFMLEGIFQGLLSWAIAVPLALLVTPIMSNAMGMAMFNSRLEFQFNYQAAFAWLAIVLAIAAVASFIPALNATRINVRQSLSYE